MKTEKEVKKQIEMLKEYKGILEKNGRGHSGFGDDRVQEAEDNIEILERFIKGDDVDDMQEEIYAEFEGNDEGLMQSGKDKAIQYINDDNDDLVCKEDIETERKYLAKE